VQLLLVLPGKKAKEFRLATGSVLIRYLGGDETLVDEIAHNRRIAQQQPDSVQRFMHNSFQDTKPSDLDLVRREKLANIIALENQNAIVQRQELQRVCEVVGTMEDPRLVSSFRDTMVNRLADLHGVSMCDKVEMHKDEDLITVDNVVTSEFGVRATTAQKSLIGREVRLLWNRENKNTEPPKVTKYIAGENRPVNAYPARYKENIVAIAQNIIPQKEHNLRQLRT